ncbi:hypothetical protein OAU25_01625 [Crocinitomicaceae bacterium]|nr:hypothetical protein [Crocinitomicaceae bacterium]
MARLITFKVFNLISKKSSQNCIEPINKRSMQTETTLQEEIQKLEGQLTGDMFQDMDIKDQIHNLEMKLKGIKPMDSHFDCVGCGS